MYVLANPVKKITLEHIAFSETLLKFGASVKGVTRNGEHEKPVKWEINAFGAFWGTVELAYPDTNQGCYLDDFDSIESEGHFIAYWNEELIGHARTLRGAVAALIAARGELYDTEGKKDFSREIGSLVKLHLMKIGLAVSNWETEKLTYSDL